MSRYTLTCLIDLDTEAQFRCRPLYDTLESNPLTASDDPLAVNRYLGWIHRLKHDDKRQIRVLLDDTTPMAMVDLHVNPAHGTADYHYCLSTDHTAVPLIDLHHAVLNLAFDQLGLRKINHVCAGAPAAELLALGFQHEASLQAHYLHDGQPVDGSLLALLASQRQPHQPSQAITLPQRDPDAVDPIDAIEAARARNNLNWMSILRLSLEKSPATAGPIVDNIKQLDREISRLTDQLTAHKTRDA